MKVSRRHFLAGVSALALSGPATAGINNPGSGGGAVSPAFSQRSVINIGDFTDFSYPFINFTLTGDGNIGPVGSAFSTGTPFPALIDANGWPNQPGANGVNFGGSVRIPGANEFSGNWIITWSGSGRADIHLGGGTWTESNLVTPGTGTFSNGSANIGFTNSFAAGQQVVFTSSGTLPTNFSLLTVYYVIATGLSGSNIQVSATKGGLAIVAGSAGSGTQTVNGTYLKNSNGVWTNTFDTVSPYIIAVQSATSGPLLCPIFFPLTDPNSTGNYLKNFKFYQQGDETDLLAGKIYRANFKQMLVNLNPSAIRFVNNYGGNSTRECRFENRTLPTNAGYSYFTNWVSSPSYPVVTGTNQYSVAVAVPTTANPKNTPASLTHGEIALVRFTNAAVRSTGQYSISAITNANPGKVTTSTAHGLNTGDMAIHFTMVGMPKLNFFPVTVTVIDANNYTIGVDTTTYGAFTSGLGTNYWSINVGARGAKPICWVTGSQPASVFGNSIGTAGSYAMLVYDKNIQIQSDGAGNMISGAWTFDSSGSNGSRGDAPLEIMTTLVNEVNALSVSQGITNPINMWVNMPHTGLTSMDPDYTTASDWAVNAVDVILNPSSVQRASGYSALTANAKLFVEYSNETWNSNIGSNYFYLNRMGFLRWPSSGTTDDIDMYVLRSTIVMRAVTAAVGTSRIKRVLAGAGFFGYSVGGLNEARVNGSTTPGNSGNFYLTDTLVTGGGFGTPITNHDCFCTATYFDGGPTYYNGQFITDSATYAGGGAGQATAIASFVSEVTSNPAADGQPINGYLNGSLTGLTATYAAAMKTLGKTAINYEGGTDWQTVTGQQTQGGHVITAADSTFLIAVTDSTQWRDAQVNYFNRTSQLAGSAMPSVFTFVGGGTASSGASNNQRWCYCTPDSFVGTTEGQALLNSPVWVGMGARNQGLA